MTRLHDAFDALIDENPPGDPDAILAAARAEAAPTGAPRRWVATRLVAAAAVALLVAGAAVIARHDGGTDDLRSGPGTSTSAAPSGTVEVVNQLSKGAVGDCTITQSVARTVSAADPVRGAFDALVMGATAAEEAEGLHSWFGLGTEGAVRSATVVDGVLRVDFASSVLRLDGVSTSCGSASLLAQLDGTAKQFPEIEQRIYSIEGDVGAFYAWLGIEPPEGVDRPSTATTAATAAENGAETAFVAPVTAVASPAGVTVTDDAGTSTEIASEPAAVAFGLQDQVVFQVFQAVEPDDSTGPPHGAGPVRVWRDGRIRTLQPGEDVTSVSLMDLGLVDGAVTALVVERSTDDQGQVWEDVVTIDLTTDARRVVLTTMGSTPRTTEAQLLPNGSFVRLATGDPAWVIQQWTEGQDGPDWTYPLNSDTVSTLALDGTTATAITPVTDKAGKFALYLIDMSLVTGQSIDPPTVVRLTTPLSGAWCQDWLSPDTLSCSRPGDDPVGIQRDGTVRPLSAETGARITVTG